MINIQRIRSAVSCCGCQIWPLPLERVRRVALHTLTELGASIAIGAACTPFLPANDSLAILGIGLAAQTAINLCLRIGREYAASQDPQWEPSIPTRAMGYTAPIVFVANSGLNAIVLWHEFGHFCAAKLLLSHSNPSIVITPYAGGITSYQDSIVSNIGNAFGSNEVLPLIASAGPGFSVLAAPFYYLGYRASRHKWPEFSRVLIIMAVTSYTTESIYAISTLWNHHGDFQRLWRVGVHPIVSVFILNSAPLTLLSVRTIRRLLRR